MKSTLCTLLYCLLFSLLAKGQDYSALIEKGDSLLKEKKFDSSFYTFEEAIEVISKQNISLPEETWLRIFIGAANSAAGGANKDKADKYWNLAKGNRGEKMPDKIETLVSRGINSITISESVFAGTKPFYIQQCNISRTTYLLWDEENSVRIQKFDDCRNYPPFEFKNLILSTTIANAPTIKLDSIMNVNNHGFHESVFEIGVYSRKSIFKKIVKNLDISNPDTMKPHEANIDREVSVKNYKANLSTSLYKLLHNGNLLIKKYESKLGSPSERLKAGSL